MAHEVIEANSTQRDRDYGAVVNWRAAEAAVAEGKADRCWRRAVIDPAKVPGVLYFLPIPKSPHGIDTDPSGRWIVASGKLQPVGLGFRLREDQDRDRSKKDFETEFRGVPVMRYESVLEGEVPVGLGPLHTQYDGKGNAYTSLFIESVVAKWKLPPWSDEERKPISTRWSSIRSGALQHRPPGHRRQRHDRSPTANISSR
jgi:nitrous-oxide reductase